MICVIGIALLLSLSLSDKCLVSAVKFKKKFGSSTSSRNKNKYFSKNQRGACFIERGQKLSGGSVTKAVALSSNGLVVAIGNPRGSGGDSVSSSATKSQKNFSDKSQEGYVQVFTYISSEGEVGVNNQIGKGSWEQMGQEIRRGTFLTDDSEVYNETDNISDNATSTAVPIMDAFGSSVALSADGKVLAVSAPAYPTFSTITKDRNAGQVWVYDFNSDDKVWKIRESFVPNNEKSEDPLLGVGGDRLGETLALSDDGSVLAVGAPARDELMPTVPEDATLNSNNTNASEVETTFEFLRNVGYVKVMKYNRSNSTWLQEGLFKGSEEDEQFGTSIDMSAAGDILAVGSAGFDRERGRVQVFQRNSSLVKIGEDVGRWRPMGQTLDGNQGTMEHAHLVSLSSDGLILVVGAPDNTNAAGRGVVSAYVFDKQSASWIPRRVAGDEEINNNGNDYHQVKGLEMGEHAGMTLSLSGDGNMLAVGSPNMPLDSSGVVRVYAWAGDDSSHSSTFVDDFDAKGWVRYGPDVKFNAGGGDVVELSDDGSVLVTTIGDDGDREVGAFRLLHMNHSSQECDSPFPSASLAFSGAPSREKHGSYFLRTMCCAIILTVSSLL